MSQGVPYDPKYHKKRWVLVTTQENNKILIYNSMGSLILESYFENQSYTFQKNDLSNGVYYYSIVNNSTSIKTGKIIFTKWK